MSARVKDLLNEQANRTLSWLGLTDRMARDVKREAWWWLTARGEAARKPAGLRRGSAVVLTSAGSCELLAIDEPAAGPGEVTVLIDASVVSPGTERAHYLRLPNAIVSYPHRPGYSAAGAVVEVGRGVTRPRIGDRVALSCPHSSLATVPASSVFAVPAQVRPEDAAAVQLGIIAALGVDCAAIRPGDAVCVVGAGPVGSIALRLARAAGADPVVAVATSRRREAAALAGGASRLLVAAEDEQEIASLAAQTVIEASGDPSALALAVAAARAGGRIVLLGSSRGLTPAVPVDVIRAKELRLVGAHISILWRDSSVDGSMSYRALGRAFLDRLADGSVRVDDLVGEGVDPREAGRFYRDLVDTSAPAGGHFDWRLLPARERLRKTSFVRTPDVGARGIEYRRRPLAYGSRRGTWLADDDPFSGARGRLRFGLLGCGDIASENAAGVQRAPNTELVACFDPITALASDLARQFGGEAVESAEALLDRRDVDAVIVAAPHDLHAKLACQAIDAGKHVIVEKPPANNLPAAIEMATAARRAGVTLSICFPQRYQPGAVAARRLIEAGALGPFTGSATSFLADRPASYWLGGFSGRAVSDWRKSRERAGGGVLIMNLSHQVDLVRHLVSQEVETVSAQSASFSGREVEDSISVAFRYDNGALGALLGSSAIRGTYDGQTSAEIRVWGEEGHISVEGGLEVFTLRAIEGLRPARWQRFHRLRGGAIRAVFASRFATALDRGEAPDVTVEDGLAVQAFIEAAYRSISLDRAVRPVELLREAGS
jgi:2-desacetyl-2-hydroxyethyl bacteriochlorophyllide A dehydrogenase